MAKRIAVETLSLSEVSEMFQESLAIAEPKFNNWLQFEKKKLRKLKITRRQHVYTQHYCERFAERVMKASPPTFDIGLEGIMYADIFGPVRFIDTVAEGVHEIEFQFQDGMAFGYRDNISKITYYKTVYSNDMLKKDRLKYHEEWKEPLSQIAELFKWK